MCIEGRKGRKIDSARYAEVFQASEPWPEARRWREYDWKIIRKVPIAELEYSTLAEYEAEAEVDPDEETQENVNRVLEVMSLLRDGEKLWPVVLGMDCMTVDGYHRLSAANELGIETIDVIYPVRRRA